MIHRKKVRNFVKDKKTAIKDLKYREDICLARVHQDVLDSIKERI